MSSPEAPGKGERTAARILAAAELLFARQGYAGTSLRQVATEAGLREPGLYNHFAGKKELYAAVLQATLVPLLTEVTARLNAATSLPDYTELPALFLDWLGEHPPRAALLRQALQDSADSTLADMVNAALATVFERAVREMTALGLSGDNDPRTLVLNLVALLNLSIGYFNSAQAIAALGGGNIEDPDNIARQKQLLHKVVRAMLIN